MDFEAAGVKRKMQLSKLDKWRERAYHNSKIYKERTKRWHDKRKKEFTPRDKKSYTGKQVWVRHTVMKKRNLIMKIINSGK
jgi:dTDP-4-amino-4,6-dideoxygalactose transaminase